MTDYTITDVVRVYQAAAWPVLNDPAVWQEEAQRTDVAPLVWPWRPTASNYQRFVAALVAADVDVVLALLHVRADGRAPALPADACDPKMQTLLRVALRSLQAGEAAIKKQIGSGRIAGLREYKNLVAEQMVEFARQHVRPGVPLERVLDFLRLPRRQAFRASKRAVLRRRKK